MSKTLVLTGIEAYTSPLVNNKNLKKGDVVRVTDDIGAKIGGSKRMNSEGQPVYYFTQATGDYEVTYDLTKEDLMAPAVDGKSALPAGPAKISVAPKPEPEPEEEEDDTEYDEDGNEVIEAPDVNGKAEGDTVMAGDVEVSEESTDAAKEKTTETGSASAPKARQRTSPVKRTTVK